jgi:hypothetical protein
LFNREREQIDGNEFQSHSRTLIEKEKEKERAKKNNIDSSIRLEEKDNMFVYQSLKR